MNDEEKQVYDESMEKLRQSPAVQHWKSLSLGFPNLDFNVEILSGKPIIKGTRIPISTIASYLLIGSGKELLKMHYPVLTDVMIDDAIDYIVLLLEK